MLKKIARFFLEKERNYLKYNEYIYRISNILLPDNIHSQKLSSLLETETKDNKITKEDNNKKEILLKKQNDYQIQESDYKEIIKKSPFGGFTNFSYKNSNFSITGCNYEHIPLENIYKSVLYTKPDIIFLCIRPDELLSKFFLNLKNPKTGKFSNRKYVNQLKMTNNNFLPGKTFENEIFKITKNSFLKNKEITDEEQIDQKTNFFSTEKIPNKILSILSLYSKINKIPLILSEMPDIIFRQIIINKLTICQMREILKQCTYKMVLNPDITPSTPLNFAYTLFPNIFQNPNDLYTSSLIEYNLKILQDKNIDSKNIKKENPENENSISKKANPENKKISTKNENLIKKKVNPENNSPKKENLQNENSILKNKKSNKLNISVFSGIGQANSIKNYLFNNKIKSLNETLAIPEIKPLLFKTISVEQYCEKLAIYDVLKIGDNFEEKKNLSLKHSRVIIRKMAGKKEGDPELEFFYKLHEDLIMKYYLRFLEDKKLAFEQKEDFYINSIF